MSSLGSLQPKTASTPHHAALGTYSGNEMELLQGQTPLHYAAAARADKVLPLLLASGADPKAADSKVSTPIVSRHGDVAVHFFTDYQHQ